MQKTSISWCDFTSNPVRAKVKTTGRIGHYCEPVSAGCANCYASRMQWPYLSQLPYSSANRDKVELFLDEAELKRLMRSRAIIGKRVFIQDMSDLFGNWVLDRWLAQVWMLMAYRPDVTFCLLTKHPDRMLSFATRWADLSGESNEPKLVRGPEETRKTHPSGRGQIFADYLESMGEPPPGCAFPTFDWMEGPRWWSRVLPNVHLGVSVENQAAADERIRILSRIPAAIRFASVEPLLGPTRLWMFPLDWVVIGGESGPGFRPFKVEWAQQILAQCRAAGVPFFMKQTSALRPGQQGEIPDELWNVKELPG